MSRFKSFFNKLKDKYRLVIINDSSFEEKFTFKLSRWNVIMMFASISVLIAILVVLFIIFTPLKALIPGYSDSETRKNAKIAMENSLDLENKLALNEAYLLNLKKALNGDLGIDSVKNVSIDTKVYSNLDYTISPEDSLLRKEIDQQEKYSITTGGDIENKAPNDLSHLNFFCPLRGEISSPFQLGVNHLGIDIVSPENETIKSILKGVVILATWSSDEGYVIIVQHSNEIISVYKHNSVLLKKPGDIVDVGESIAIVGNSGELTDGPHLHFEMWYKGLAINPSDYIFFN